MSYLEQLYALKCQNILKDEGRYAFPEYLRLIRKSLGFTRQRVADLMNCSVTKIYYLEHGVFGTRGPDPEFIVCLSKFYNLDGPRMLTKFHEYMQNPDRPLKPIQINISTTSATQAI